MFSVFVCTYRFTNQAVQVQVLDISVKFLFLYQMKFIYFNAYTSLVLPSTVWQLRKFSYFATGNTVSEY